MSGNSGPGFSKRPEHTVTISPANETITIRFDGKEIAHSSRALKLSEASYPPVYYLPIEDVSTEVLEKTEHSTYCPFKGAASYWSLVASDGKRRENAVWAYETPYDEVLEIKDHVAFYTSAVEAVETR